MKRIWFLVTIFVGAFIIYSLALVLRKTYLAPTGLIHFVSGTLLVGLGLKLRHTLIKSKTKDVTIKYFIWVLALFGIFMLFLGIPHLALFGPKEIFPAAFYWFWSIGLIPLFISESFAIMVAMHFLFPKRKIKYWAFAFIAVFGAVIVIINFLQPWAATFNAETGITIYNVRPTTIRLVPPITILSYGLAGIFFIYNGIKSRLNRLVLIRSLLLGIGFLIIVGFGPLHNSAQTTFLMLVADIFTILGFLTVAAGVLYSGKKETEAV